MRHSSDIRLRNRNKQLFIPKTEKHSKTLEDNKNMQFFRYLSQILLRLDVYNIEISLFIICVLYSLIVSVTRTLIR